MIVKHHNKTFKNEHIIVNDNAFFNCNLIDCVLECIDDQDTKVALTNCYIIGPEFIGSGWPYDFIEKAKEATATGEPFDYKGPIGNKKHTLH